MSSNNIKSSFRDPSGFLFIRKGSIYRQINNIYKEHYDYLIKSGLYTSLIKSNLLIHHNTVKIKAPEPNDVYRIIKPELIPFISYPHEWSFSQLKDAALTTLKIQKNAIEHGMSLKDSSVYNIQFKDGKPILIDTLSFEKYQEGLPWIAYKQFCQHFLAPLALMAYTDIRLSQLFRIYIDGIPLDLASSLLPSIRTRTKYSLLTHIHLHAKSQKYYADKGMHSYSKKLRISKLAFLALIDSLESAVKKLKLEGVETEWADYYEETNYTTEGIEHKKKILSQYLDKAKPESVWDLGANIGLFSRIASNRGIFTLSIDFDPIAVEKNYIKSKKNNENRILPLLIDLTNPSPGIGWENRERYSLIERGPSDTIFALALIHHLAISNNLPFIMIAEFFHKLCRKLIIEFIPKSDSQVIRLLSTRKDIFQDYNQKTFEREFKKFFDIKSSEKITDSKRTIYYMITKR